MVDVLAPPRPGGLPDDADLDPMQTLEVWLEEARQQGVKPNPDAVTLATTEPDGRPSARMVLARKLDVRRGFLGIYTDGTGRKGRALAHCPYAALVFHWDGVGRQVRLEGPVRRAPDADSDDYFAGRPVQSQIAAWASRQSEPIESRAALEARFEAARQRFGVSPEGIAPAPIPRPPEWGGYRVWAERVELWVSRPARLHDRLEFERTLEPDGDGFRGGAWRARRLQP